MKSLFKENEIGKYDLCPCGSGMKFKWCCGTNNGPLTYDTFCENVIGDVKYRPFDEEQKKLWRTSIVKLPSEIKDSLIHYLEREYVVEYCCYFNSCHLSLLNKNIKTVQGWYGTKLVNEEINSLLKFKKTNTELKNTRYLKIRDEIGLQIIDTKNFIKFNPHSWNEYNGIHFDITTEKNTTYDDWVYYNQWRIFDDNFINSNELIKKLYLEKIKEKKLEGKKMGRKILNRGLLNILINSEKRILA